MTQTIRGGVGALRAAMAGTVIVPGDADYDDRRRVWNAVNTMSEYGDERLRASFGSAKYDRLAGIKTTYDPGNFFHRNANIKPA